MNPSTARLPWRPRHTGVVCLADGTFDCWACCGSRSKDAYHSPCAVALAALNGGSASPVTASLSTGTHEPPWVTATDDEVAANTAAAWVLARVLAGKGISSSALHGVHVRGDRRRSKVGPAEEAARERTVPLTEISRVLRKRGSAHIAGLIAEELVGEITGHHQDELLRGLVLIGGELDCHALCNMPTLVQHRRASRASHQQAGATSGDTGSGRRSMVAGVSPLTAAASVSAAAPVASSSALRTKRPRRRSQRDAVPRTAVVAVAAIEGSNGRGKSRSAVPAHQCAMFPLPPGAVIRMFWTGPAASGRAWGGGAARVPVLGMAVLLDDHMRFVGMAGKPAMVENGGQPGDDKHSVGSRQNFVRDIKRALPHVDADTIIGGCSVGPLDEMSSSIGAVVLRVKALVPGALAHIASIGCVVIVPLSGAVVATASVQLAGFATGSAAVTATTGSATGSPTGNCGGIPSSFDLCVLRPMQTLGLTTRPHQVHAHAHAGTCAAEGRRHNKGRGKVAALKPIRAGPAWELRVVARGREAPSTFSGNILSIWGALRQWGAWPRPALCIEYCTNCEDHQLTSWHRPGMFGALKDEVCTAVGERFSRLIVRANPARSVLGGFVVSLSLFPGSLAHTVYDTSRGPKKGLLPTAGHIIGSLETFSDCYPGLFESTREGAAAVVCGYSSMARRSHIHSAATATAATTAATTAAANGIPTPRTHRRLTLSRSNSSSSAPRRPLRRPASAHSTRRSGRSPHGVHSGTSPRTLVERTQPLQLASSSSETGGNIAAVDIYNNLDKTQRRLLTRLVRLNKVGRPERARVRVRQRGEGRRLKSKPRQRRSRGEGRGTLASDRFDLIDLAGLGVRLSAAQCMHLIYQGGNPHSPRDGRIDCVQRSPRHLQTSKSVPRHERHAVPEGRLAGSVGAFGGMPTKGATLSAAIQRAEIETRRIVDSFCPGGGKERGWVDDDEDNEEEADPIARYPPRSSNPDPGVRRGSKALVPTRPRPKSAGVVRARSRAHRPPSDGATLGERGGRRHLRASAASSHRAMSYPRSEQRQGVAEPLRQAAIAETEEGMGGQSEVVGEEGGGDEERVLELVIRQQLCSECEGTDGGMLWYPASQPMVWSWSWSIPETMQHMQVEEAVLSRLWGVIAEASDAIVPVKAMDAFVVASLVPHNTAPLQSSIWWVQCEISRILAAFVFQAAFEASSKPIDTTQGCVERWAVICKGACDQHECLRQLILAYPPDERIRPVSRYAESVQHCIAAARQIASTGRPGVPGTLHRGHVQVSDKPGKSSVAVSSQQSTFTVLCSLAIESYPAWSIEVRNGEFVNVGVVCAWRCV